MLQRLALLAESSSALRSRAAGAAGAVLAGSIVCCVPSERPEPKRDSTLATTTPSAAKRQRDKKARLEARKRPDAAARRASVATTPVPIASSAEAPPGAPAGEELLYDFDGPSLGPDWNLTSAAWKLDKGRLCVQGARNHPAWLRRPLAKNARIEFDAVSSSPEGDIKVEVWGDGKSAAVSTSYTNASSYVVIFGGWKNSFHVLARVDEHAKNRPEVRIDPGGDLRAQPVLIDRIYHFKIERNDGKTVRWYVDDIEIIGFSDPAPLAGPGHEHLGFNNWETRVCFDNLHVVPL